ncbi:MAG TPA: hypothetical protein VMU94_27920 [Streptosporangiaceae bacterium]|nr:hypothetical protein [Streptosporangiaceae bacterium]
MWFDCPDPAAAGFSATDALTFGSSTKTCSCTSSGVAVAKILPRTRNEVMSKCGSSVASGSASANRRTRSRSIRSLSGTGSG